jgi:hypothetical protein
MDYAAGAFGHAQRVKPVSDKEKVYCDYVGCTYSTTRPGFLVGHRAIHTGVLPFVCTHEGCDFAAARETQLMVHKRSVHMEEGGVLHACPAPNCGYITASAASLIIHTKSHTATSERTVAHHCTEPGCTFFSFTTNLLARHFRAAHVGAGDADGNFACSLPGCDFKTKRRTYLRNHSQRVHPNGRFSCKHCPELQFPGRVEWMSHYMGHVVGSRSTHANAARAAAPEQQQLPEQ